MTNNKSSEMKVAIIKYNAGNIYSVYCACKRLGADAVITDNPEEIHNADRVIFPGVGEARAAMDYLRANQLDQLIISLKQPVLGICIGMQLLCRESEEGAIEGENTRCLGIFDVAVNRFRPADPDLKVPQMGWNQIQTPSGCELFQSVQDGAFVYYVHSYRVPVCPYTIATTEYGETYSAALRKNNFWATQFHPEKSGSVGEQILRNFLTNIND